MPRKRGTNAAETKSKLLAAAGEEFAAKGYSHASLREICSKADVTTGALYFFFDSKEALFEAVLAPFTDALVNLIDESYPTGKEASTDWVSGDRAFSKKILDLCIDNRRIVKIMRDNSDIPCVHDFLETIISNTANHLKEHMPPRVSGDGTDHADIASHWFARLQVESVLDILSQGLSRKNALVQLEYVVGLLSNGFAAMLELDKE